MAAITRMKRTAKPIARPMIQLLSLLIIFGVGVPVINRTSEVDNESSFPAAKTQHYSQSTNSHNMQTR